MGVNAQVLKQLRKLLRWTRGLSLAARLLGTTAMVAFSAVLQWLLWETVNPHFFFLFLPAIALSSLFFERMTGLYAVVLSTAVYMYFFTEPFYTVNMRPDHYITVILFVVSSTLIAVVAEFFRLLTDALDEANDMNSALIERQHMLMQEMRHRIRNYLHIVSATVGSEANEAEHEETQARLERVARRIAGVAHVTRTLDEPDPGQLFDAREYLEGLVEEIAATLAGNRAITVRCHAEAVPIDGDTAELLGVIVNELITNAMKYAFPDGGRGTVHIEFSRTPSGDFRLTVSDNGVGRSAREGRRGTGLGLVSALAKLRGGGMVTEDATPGFRVAVVMKPTQG